LANVASKCRIEYSAMGATGYLYESVKDELKWAGLRRKCYVAIISKIGSLIVLEDEEYNKKKVQETKMEADEMANALIQVFGSGE